MKAVPQLDYYDEFEALLQHYRPSDVSLGILRDTEIVLLVAPSGAGRNSVIRELLKTGDYRYMVSDTTRPKRVNDGVPEKNGVEYWFKPEAEVLKDLQDGKYVEAAIVHGQQVSGVHIGELMKAQAANEVAITDMEIQGMDTFLKYKKDAKVIFLVPPNFDEWIRRLRARGVMEHDELHRRLISAEYEITRALSLDFIEFVVNDTLPEAAAKIDKIVRGDAASQQSGQKARLAAMRLADDLAKFMKK